MKKAMLVLLAAGLAGLAGCERTSATATALYFSEQEQGSDPFSTRMLVTDEFLRMDDGVDDGDFLLFDREKPAVYSVSRREQRILVLTPLAITLAAPQPFEHTIVKEEDEQPDIDGRKVSHYRLLTNGAQCFDVFAAEGLLPGPLEALREYQQAIAGEHAAAMAHTPKEFQSGCDLANNIFVPARHLAHGFPVRQEDMAGNVRQLVDYRLDYPAGPELFELPKGFTEFSIRDLRGE